ncbi:MAG: AMP-binding protein [Ilumatobacteraceae bacterium]
MNLASILESHPGETPAIISRGKTFTFADVRKQVAAMRGALDELGIGKGDRLALLCGNTIEFVVAYFACLGRGIVCVPLNPTAPAPELQRELSVVGARAVVVAPAAVAGWSNLDRAALPHLAHVIAATGELSGALRFQDLVEHPPAPVVELEPDELAVMLFTSGTAGSPKAAMLSHGNLRSNLDQVSFVRKMDGTDLVYGVLPLFHIFGLNVVLAYSLMRGSAVVLVERFDPMTAIETIRDRKVTLIPGAPPLWMAFEQMPNLPKDTFASVRTALTGASKMPEHTTRSLFERFGLLVTEGYGLTECSPVVTTTTDADRETALAKIGSIGRVLPGVEVRVVDENGDNVLRGDAGEIWVRGPNVFRGYFEDPQATARALTPDGWLRTGDVAVVDDDGFLFLVDRAKDLIIVSGFNVYPAEVEEAILEHSAVAQAAVVGVEHPHTGEAVRAYVVLRDGHALDEDALIDHCRGRLARYKCPTKVLFVPQLPTGSTGKVLRRALR